MASDTRLPGDPGDVRRRPAFSRPFRIALVISLGILLSRRLEMPPALGGWLFLTCAAAAASGLGSAKTRGRRMALLAFGLALARGAAPQAGEEGDPALDGGNIRVVATVSSAPAVKTQGRRQAARTRTIFQTSDPDLAVAVEGDAGFLQPGHIVALAGTIRFPGPPRNPGEPEHRSSLPYLHVLRPELLELRGFRGPGRGFGWLASALREKLRGLVFTLYSGSSRGLVLAILLGDRRWLEPRISEAFRDTGTYHHLAISGLHASVLLALFLRVPLPARLRAPIQLAAFFIFAAVTGAAPAVMRAVLMISCVVLAKAARRALRTLDAWAWTVGLAVFWNPDWLFDIGFQLSVLAVFALLAWGACIDETLPGSAWARRLREMAAGVPGNSWPFAAFRGLLSAAAGLTGGLRQALVLALAATLGTAPLVLYHFQRAYPLGIIWGIAVGYPVTAILLFGALSLAAGAVFPVLGMPFAWPAAAAASLLDGFLPALAGVPGSSWALPAPPAWAAFLSVVLVLAGPFFTPTWIPARTRRPLLRAAALGLLMLPFALRAFSTSDPEIWFFDVGAGSAQVIRLPGGGAVLIDAGSADEAPAGLGQRLSEALLAAGIRHLDGVFLTHPDADHVNAVEELLRRTGAEQVWVSPFFEEFQAGRELLERLRARGLSAHPSARGDRLSLPGGGRLEVFHPCAAEPLPLIRRSNEGSLALRFSWKGRTVFFCGDLEEEGSARLLSYGDDLRSDILVLPHHGRANRLLDPLLSAVAPRWILISGNGGGGGRSMAEALEKRGFRVHTTWRDAAGRGAFDPAAGWTIEAPFRR